MSDAIKDCPFCGSKPVFPDVKDVYGTCYEAGCEECGFAVISIQIIDCFDYVESPTREQAHASYDEKEMQYGHNYIGIVRDSAIMMWNGRTEYPEVTMQDLSDAGLNSFAVKLLSESVVANEVSETVKFKFRNVGITIEPLK